MQTSSRGMQWAQRASEMRDGLRQGPSSSCRQHSQRLQTPGKPNVPGKFLKGVNTPTWEGGIRSVEPASLSKGDVQRTHKPGKLTFKGVCVLLKEVCLTCLIQSFDELWLSKG